MRPRPMILGMPCGMGEYAVAADVAADVEAMRKL